MEVNIAILNADAKDTKAIAYVKVANAKIADIIDADLDPVDAKVFVFDRNINDGQQVINSKLSIPIDDKLKEKLKNTDVADFKKKVPEENLANQFSYFLRIIFDKIVSWKTKGAPPKNLGQNSGKGPPHWLACN